MVFNFYGFLLRVERPLAFGTSVVVSLAVVSLAGVFRRVLFLEEGEEEESVDLDLDLDLDLDFACA